MAHPTAPTPVRPTFAERVRASGLAGTMLTPRQRRDAAAAGEARRRWQDAQRAYDRAFEAMRGSYGGGLPPLGGEDRERLDDLAIAAGLALREAESLERSALEGYDRRQGVARRAHPDDALAAEAAHAVLEEDHERAAALWAQIERRAEAHERYLERRGDHD